MANKNFEVYRTSAGAGKTYTIVREFIRLCLMGSYSADSTVAITFTNKAAGEMKDRILEYLYALWQKRKERPEIAALFDELSGKSGLSHETVATEAGKILQHILHNYSRFSISTIDSFVHDILKMFSHDLKLPENFDVETDDDLLAEMVVSELLARLERPDDNDEVKKLTGYIIDLAMNRFEEKDNWDITGELIKYAKMLLSEQGMANIPDIAKFPVSFFEEAIQGLKKIQNASISELSEIGKEAIRLIKEYGLSEEDFYYKNTGIAGYFKKISTCTKDTDFSVKSRVQQTIDEGKWVSGKNDIPENLKTSLTELFNKIQSFPLKDYLKLTQHLLMQLGPMALLAKMQHILAEYNITNQVVPIAEFNRHIANVVRNEPAPFIYERLGQKYKHYLIDEFQDTSVSQWHNFLPLIDNSLSLNNNVMIVGDVKQSIYRFRNGEMEQLMILPNIYDKPEQQHYEDFETTLNYNFYDKSESPDFTNINYRSGQYIVELNNLQFKYIRELFEQDNKNRFIAKAYNNHEQKFPEKAEGKGEVVFYPLGAEKYKDSTLQQIYNIILGYERKSDIAVLTRGKDKAKEISAFLMQQIPPVQVISNESLELGFSPAVNFITDILKIIHDPHNEIAVIGAYTFLQQYKSSVSNLYNHQHDWLNKITEQSTFVSLREQFEKLLTEAGYDAEILRHTEVPVRDIVSGIIREFGLAETPDAYIMFFQNKLSDFSEKNHEGLGGIMKWWDEKGKSTSIVVPEGTDAVKIMTVHKAKGLQFPVVIYPFADFKLRDTAKSTWVPSGLFPDELMKASGLNSMPKLLVGLSMHQSLPDGKLKELLSNEILKQELDAMNIHYVAMTRAKHSLHVLFRDNREKENINGYLSINSVLNNFVTIYNELFTETVENGVKAKRFGQHTGKAEKFNDKIQEQPELQHYTLRKHSEFKTMRAFEFTSSAIESGMLFHEFVSLTDDLSRYHESFEKFAEQRRLSTEQKEKLLNMVVKFSEFDEIKKLFSENMCYLNETTIIEGNKTYRPDKIIYSEQKTYVIDFKTGKKNPSHLAQIKAYAELLGKMNFKDISTVLVYVSEDDIEVVRDNE